MVHCYCSYIKDQRSWIKFWEDIKIDGQLSRSKEHAASLLAQCKK